MNYVHEYKLKDDYKFCYLQKQILNTGATLKIGLISYWKRRRK